MAIGWSGAPGLGPLSTVGGDVDTVDLNILVFKFIVLNIFF
jgi:hypothetical protein